MPRAVDLSLAKQKEDDEEWLASLALIREITRQEKQEEDDRIMAAELAGMQIERQPDERRGMAMLLNDRDDDDDDNRKPPAPTNDRRRFVFSTIDRRMTQQETVSSIPPAKQ
jgi:hypothetical protein